MFVKSINRTLILYAFVSIKLKFYSVLFRYAATTTTVTIKSAAETTTTTTIQQQQQQHKINHDYE